MHDKTFAWHPLIATGEIALDLHGCNTSHSVKLQHELLDKTGLEPIVIPILDKEDGTELTRRIRDLAQVIPNFSILRRNKIHYTWH